MSLQESLSKPFSDCRHGCLDICSLQHSRNQELIYASVSDTTGPSLILLFFFLASYPEHAEKIHVELTSVDLHDISALSALPHLNGVINESMRLFPAALTMGTRVTPKEGLYVEETFIPGNTKIAAPRYSIFRRKSLVELC